MVACLTDLSRSGGPVSVLVHDGPWYYSRVRRLSGSGWRSRPLHDLRDRGPVAQRWVRALGVVVAEPGLNDDLRLGLALEGLVIEQLVAQLRVEALAVDGLVSHGLPGWIGVPPEKWTSLK